MRTQSTAKSPPPKKCTLLIEQITHEQRERETEGERDTYTKTMKKTRETEQQKLQLETSPYLRIIQNYEEIQGISGKNLQVWRFLEGSDNQEKSPLFVFVKKFLPQLAIR